MKLLVGIALMSMAAFVPTADAATKRGSDPTAVAAYAQFREARDADRFEVADEAARRVIGLRQKIRNKDPMLQDVVEYLLFQRGDCDLEARVQRMRLELDMDEGAMVCRALRLDPNDTEGRRQSVAELFDTRSAHFNNWSSDVFDLYARQAVIDRRALRWLVDSGIDSKAFEWHDESALIAQIRYGRAGNVRYLLDLGYNANAGTIGPGSRASDEAWAKRIESGSLPLQAARDALAMRGEAGLDVARVLLEHGANPNKLRWYPRKETSSAADAGLLNRFDAMMEASASKMAKVTAEFRGLLIESTPEGERVYARFLVGNGSGQPVAIPAWTVEGDYLLDGLRVHLEHRQAGGTTWDKGVLALQHGYSPQTKLVLAPGQSHEILYAWSVLEVLNAPRAMQYRLVFWADDGEHVSDPFLPRGDQDSLDYVGGEKKREWHLRR